MTGAELVVDLAFVTLVVYQVLALAAAGVKRLWD